MSMPPPPPPPSSPTPPPPSFGAPPPYPGGPVGSGPVARPGLRIAARFLDGMILGLVELAIVAAMLASGEQYGFGGVSAKHIGTGKLFTIALVGLALSFVYEAMFTAKYGGTPMKRAFGMRVVDATTGAPVTFQQSVIRWAVPGLAGLVPRLGPSVRSIVTLVSLVFLFTDSRRQTVSDKAAKTVVVGGR